MNPVPVQPVASVLLHERVDDSPIVIEVGSAESVAAGGESAAGELETTGPGGVAFDTGSWNRYVSALPESSFAMMRMVIMDAVTSGSGGTEMVYTPPAEDIGRTVNSELLSR